MVLNTDWAQVEVIDLINDGSGLAFGIIGGRSTGVVVKTIVPGGVADRDGRLQSGDHILQIGEVNLRGLGSEQVASVLRQCGVHVRMVVARPVESTSADYNALGSHAPIVPTKILGDPAELDKHLNENGYSDIYLQNPSNSAPYIFTGQADVQLHTISGLVDVVRNPQPIGSLPASMANLSEAQLPETETYAVDLIKDELGLGITVAGYVCEKEEINGIFVKSISKGSAASQTGQIKINDRIIEVNGKSLVGHNNHEAVEILRKTGSHVRIGFERYLRGPKYEQLQMAILANEYRPLSPASASVSSLPQIPLSLVHTSSLGIEPEGESRTSADIDSTVLQDLETSENQIIIDTSEGRRSVQFSICSHDSIQEKWKDQFGSDVDIVIAEMVKEATTGLGISLEGTVDVEDGKEVRPHHYIRNILPHGPVGINGILKSGDELLEVNGIRLLGLNHLEVVSILKQLPCLVILVCARYALPSRIIDTAQHRDAFQARNILAESFSTLIHHTEKLVKAKSDTSIASSIASEACCSMGSRSRSLEIIAGLPMWDDQPTVVTLNKGDHGLGFSILDYQDPLNPQETVIVIRSLVPGGVAHQDGNLIPGDRLLCVNDVDVEHVSLDKAVQVLKGAPKGPVKISVAKPLSSKDKSQDTEEDHTCIDDFQECIEEYQEGIEVVQICIEESPVRPSASSSRRAGDEANGISELELSFKSTCDIVNNSTKTIVKVDSCERTRTEDSEYETCMDESFSEETNKTPTNHHRQPREQLPMEEVAMELTKLESADKSAEISSATEVPVFSSVAELARVSTPINKPSEGANGIATETFPPTTTGDDEEAAADGKGGKENDFCRARLASCSDPCLNYNNKHVVGMDANPSDDELKSYECAAKEDEFFLVQLPDDEVSKCRSEPNVLERITPVTYRYRIEEYYNDIEDCLQAFRLAEEKKIAESERQAMQTEAMSKDNITDGLQPSGNDGLLLESAQISSESEKTIISKQDVAMPMELPQKLQIFERNLGELEEELQKQEPDSAPPVVKPVMPEELIKNLEKDVMFIDEEKPELDDCDKPCDDAKESLQNVQLDIAEQIVCSLEAAESERREDPTVSVDTKERRRSSTIMEKEKETCTQINPLGDQGKLVACKQEDGRAEQQERRREWELKSEARRMEKLKKLGIEKIDSSVQSSSGRAESLRPNASSTKSKSVPDIFDEAFLSVSYGSSDRRQSYAPNLIKSENVIPIPMTVQRIDDDDDESRVMQQQQPWGPLRTVTIHREKNSGLGISIVGGKVDLHRQSTSETILGIFIKNVVADSPAGRSGQLRTGDRILEVSGVSLKSASHEDAVKTIKYAKNPVVFVVQSLKTDNELPLSPKEMPQAAPRVQLKSIPSQKSVDFSEKVTVNSIDPKPAIDSSDESDDDEDERDLTGRTISKKGQEIDRASAGNLKRSIQEVSADPEEEDDFGYTNNKVKKKYASLGQSILMVQLERSTGQGLGLSLAGHKDRNCMAVFVCGINPAGAAHKSGGIQVGDEILEVNGVVLHGRCHLNASAIIKGLSGPIFKVIILRRKAAIDDIAVRPITQFPVSLAEEASEESFSNYPNVRTVSIKKGSQSLGIMIIEGKHAEVGQGIFISDIQEGSSAEKAGLEIGEMILAVNKDSLLGSNYDTAANLLKRTEGLVTLVVSNPGKKSAVQDDKNAATKGLKAGSGTSRPTTPTPEPPADPATCAIVPGRDTTIELVSDNKTLGLCFVGGKDTPITGGIMVVDVFPGGAAAKDSRLQPGDQILDVNGTSLKDVTHNTASQALRQTLPKMKIIVHRCESEQFETIDVEFVRKPGKGLGLSVSSRKCGKGVYVTEVLNGGCADVDGKVIKGDLLVSVNGQSLMESSGEEAGVLLKTITGKVNLKLRRYKPSQSNAASNATTR